MKKIYSIFTHSLLALLLAITPLFSSTLSAAPNETENLEAWAKMYEDMNQASGGEIEKLMKDMEQSGELDALMKELEQSGELDNIIDAMIKSTPQDFMQNLEQEAQKEKAQAPVTYPEPVVATKTSVPATPIMQVDKSKLKQVQALLNSIVSKIATIRQKASVRTSVQRELTPWEYNLTDLSYYLTTIQDEALAKYLQQPEFASLYDHLVALNRSLSIEEPRLQVEEMLDIEFEDPYITLGFSTSNISKAQAEKKYTELAAQKNPFAIKDQLKKQGLAPAEIDAQFKIAQKEYYEIFDAYKRIEQKETSSQAFLAILQALHTAVYKDLIIDDVKKLLGKYDPEALKLKEAQEAKEKDARDYKARVASQRPEFIPPIFDWPSFGSDKGSSDKGDYKSRGNGYSGGDWPDFDWGDTSGGKGGTSADAKGKGAGDKAKEKEKEKDKGTKDKDKKKDDAKKPGDGKPKDDKGKEEKPTADKKAAEITKAINALKIPLDQVSTTIDDFFVTRPVPPRQNEAMYLENIDKVIPMLDKLSEAINFDVRLFQKEIDQAKGDTAKDAAKKELQKYYKTIEDAFDKKLYNDQSDPNKDKRKKTIDNLYNRIKDPKKPAGLQISDGQKTAYFITPATATPGTPSRIEKLQKSYANVVYAVTNTSPKSINDALVKVSDLAKKNEVPLKQVIQTVAINQNAANIITNISKELTTAATSLTTSKDKLKNTPIKEYHEKDINSVIKKQLNADTLKILDPIYTMQVQYPGQSVVRSPATIQASTDQQQKPIDEFKQSLRIIKTELFRGTVPPPPPPGI